MRDITVTLTDVDLREIAADFEDPEHAFNTFSEMIDDHHDEFEKAVHEEALKAIRRTFILASLPRTPEDLIRMMFPEILKEGTNGKPFD